MAFTTALLVMLLVAPLAFVANAQTTVDWTLGKDYTSYTTQSFKPGGTIVFNYDKSQHDVLVVNKNDYDTCNSGSALQTFKDGKTSVTLKQGPMYFICGTPGHCVAGMKLQVSVGDSGSSTPATPATPATPTPAGSGSSSTPSAPSPKDSNVAAGISSGLMLSVTLVLGAVFAFMC